MFLCISFVCYFLTILRTGDEDDGYDETLIPVDFVSTGQIVDDDIFTHLVKPMKRGVNVTVLVSFFVLFCVFPHFIYIVPWNEFTEHFNQIS